MTLLIILISVLILCIVLFIVIFIRWGTRWGATDEECAMQMTGDSFLDGGPANRTAMTRAVSINKPPEVVWPWLAQLGRGAGWYSYERLDNGGKTSARHIVSWIPEPQLGDASAIGYLRYLEQGRELVWWISGHPFLGCNMRMVTDIRVTPKDGGSRLVIRISGDAAGFIGRLVIWVFQFVDSIMARRQLLGIKERVELYGARSTDPEQPETDLRDQYQLYEVIYASGEVVGVRGKEKAAYWRRTAIEDGVIEISLAKIENQVGRI